MAKALFGGLTLLVMSAALAATGCSQGEDRSQPRVTGNAPRDLKPATPSGPAGAPAAGPWGGGKGITTTAASQ